MAFPSWHYPDSLPVKEYCRAGKLKTVRDTVADYGEHGGISLVNDDWITQKGHQPMKDRLIAQFPSLPLRRPIKLPYDFEDPCCAAAARTRKRWKRDYINMKRLLPRMQATMNREPSRFSSLEALKKGFSRDLPPDRKPPKWLSGIILRDGFMRTDIPLTYNSRYNGGLLTHLPLPGLPGSRDEAGLPGSRDEAGLLVYCDALTQRQLTMSPVRIDNHRLTLAREETERVMPESVFELNSAVADDVGYVSVRGNTSCRLIRVKQDGGDSRRALADELWTLENGDSKPTAVCTSPYIAGEMVSCWDNGDVIIKSHNYCDTVMTEHRPRFSVLAPPWLRADYGPTPRSLLVTDHTAMDLVDLRTGRAKEEEIFAIPSKHCLNNELIVTSSRHPTNAFYHFLATDYNLFLLDQRMPRFVVLQMRPSFRQPPQYMKILPATNQGGVDHVIVANQSARETLIYPVTCCTSDDVAPRLPDVPWRVSQIEDFIYQCGLEQERLETRKSLVQRFTESSLLGVTALHVDAGISILQMSTTGDVFHQEYSPATSGDQDKSSASGLDRKWIADDIVREYCKEWLEEAEGGMAEAVAAVTFTDRFPVVDATNLYRAVSGDVKPHHRCPMCQENPRDEVGTETRDEVGTDDTGDESLMECRQCGLSLDAANKLKQRMEGSLSTRDNQEELIADLMESLQPPETDKFTDPQSRILLKLWHEDYNISEEIEDRFKFLELERKKVYGDDYQTDVTETPKLMSQPKPTSAAATPQKRLKTQNKPPSEFKTPEMPCTSMDKVESQSVRSSQRKKRIRRLSTSDMEETISQGVQRLFKYESEQESDSVITRLDPGSESDFDDAELEMFQLSNIPGSFSFIPGAED